MQTVNTITPASINAAAKTREKIIAREEFANEPMLLPVVSARRVDNRSGEGFRVQISVQGIASIVTVWDRDAAPIGEAIRTAPKNNAGYPVVPVSITATWSEPQTDATGRRTPGYYNLTARPATTQSVDSLASVFG